MLFVTLPPSVHAIVQPETTVATGTRDGNKWLDMSGGSFFGDSPVELSCLRFLSLLNIII